jgi:predicted DNA-binding antitoxin AbrB/MazE fold protein
MNQSVEAIYENGVLKLLGPLSLREQERVKVTISKPESTKGNLLDSEFVASCQQHAMDAPSLEEVRKALSVIPGTLTEDFGLERDED